MYSAKVYPETKKKGVLTAIFGSFLKPKYETELSTLCLDFYSVFSLILRTVFYIDYKYSIFSPPPTKHKIILKIHIY